jgi:hypothetical protein
MHCATTEYRCRREAAIHIKSLRGIFLSHRKCGTLRLHRTPGQTSWGDIRPFLELGIPFTKSLSLHISLGGVSIRIDPKIHQAGWSPKGAGNNPLPRTTWKRPIMTGLDYLVQEKYLQESHTMIEMAKEILRRGLFSCHPKRSSNEGNPGNLRQAPVHVANQGRGGALLESRTFTYRPTGWLTK